MLNKLKQFSNIGESFTIKVGYKKEIADLGNDNTYCIIKYFLT